MRYDAYLKSEHWHETRRAKLSEVGHRCQGCDSTELLEVHHLTYDRLGNERMRDLMVLCHLCHSREHGRSPRVGPVAGVTAAELADEGRSRFELERRQRRILRLSELRAVVQQMHDEDSDRKYQRDIRFVMKRIDKLEERASAT